jgi:hypothetical protein
VQGHHAAAVGTAAAAVAAAGTAAGGAAAGIAAAGVGCKGDVRGGGRGGHDCPAGKKAQERSESQSLQLLQGRHRGPPVCVCMCMCVCVCACV